MADFVPMVRPIRLKRALLALLPMTLLIVASAVLWQGEPWPIVLVLWTYLIVVLVVRRSQMKHHQRGIRLLRRRAWDEAIGHFQKSYDYFTRRPPLDRHSWLFLVSSPMSLCEMALLNMAFCAAQAGRRAESQALYERVLAEFPGSPMAVTSLNLMRDQPSPGEK